MTEENSTAEQKADAESEAQKDQSSKDSSLEDSSSDNKIDYEAELKKEQELRKKAEEILATDRYKLANGFIWDEQEQKWVKPQKKSIPDEKSEEEEDEDEDKAVSRIQQETQRSLKMINESQAIVLAGQLSSTEPEKQLILAKWRNRQFPDGMSLAEQLDEAFVLANGKRLIAERNEALRALKGKEGVSKDIASIKHENATVGEPKVSPDVKQVLQRQGFTYNKEAKRYEKKVGLKTITKDLATGKVYQVGIPQAPPGA